MSDRRRAALVAAAVVATLGAALVGWVAFRLWLASMRRTLRIIRWVLLVVTFRLYGPCPDCHKYIHARARLCHRCGFRRS